MKESRNDTNLVIFLASLCFFLSAIENSIPKPFLFMRLGLANAPILFALFLLKGRNYVFLTFIKVLGQAILSGTLFSYTVVFSLCGTFASALGMYVLYNVAKNHVTCVGISLLGSLLNAVVQLFLAHVIAFGQSAILIAPLLFVFATITGILLGVFSELFLQHSEWFAYVKEGRSSREFAQKTMDNDNDTSVYGSNGSDNNVEAGADMGADVALRKIKKRRFSRKGLVSSFFVFCSIVFFNLFQAHGKVLWTIFSLEVTSGALILGVKRATVLVGMVFFSKLVVSSSFRLPGALGKTLDRIFYYLALLTDTSHKHNETVQSNEPQREILHSNKRKRIKSFFSLDILKRIDARLVEVYFSAF